MRRISSLDGLRAISIAFVLLGHLSGTRGFPLGFTIFEYYASFGVRVFFVISGFLITGLLLRERERASRIDLLEFYRRRFYRIFPPAYFYMLVVTILAWRMLKAFDITAAFLYFSNYHEGPWPLGHLWSLSVEEQFYLLWPALLVLLFALRSRLLVLATVCCPLMRVIFHLWGWRYVDTGFFTVCDAIAAGCLLSVYWEDLHRLDKLLLSKGALVWPLLALALPLQNLGGPRLLHNIYYATGFTVMNLSIALCVYNAVRMEWRILNIAPIVWVGKVSYSLYLWQQLFLDRQNQHSWINAFPQNLLLAFACAATSYYVVEQPFLRLRDRRKRRMGTSKAPVAAT
jgi:peptidoglycan/LPS O-acetylase OafA/YrhL